MHRTKVLFLVIIVIVLLHVIVSKELNDVLKTIVDKHADKLIKSAEKHAPNVKLPDVKKVVSLGMLGKIEVEMKNLKVKSVKLNKPTVGKNNAIKFKQSSVKLDLDWKVNLSGKKHKGSATVKLTFDSKIEFEIVPNSKLFQVKNTSLKITDTNIKVKGGPDFIQKAINGTFKQPIQDELKKHLEPGVDKLLTAKLNKLVAKHSTKIKTEINNAASETL
jgi:hypothetical protein